MKFLIDNALSPALATFLQQSGYDAIHVRSIGLQHAEDDVIFERGVAEDRIIVSADVDFGTLLAARSSRKPSVIQFRGEGSRNPMHWREYCSRICPNSSTHWKAAASSRSSHHGFECACFRLARGTAMSRSCSRWRSHQCAAICLRCMYASSGTFASSVRLTTGAHAGHRAHVARRRAVALRRRESRRTSVALSPGCNHTVESRLA
jgi:predicted nuclease of predicted toxin-antitoxin system